MFICKSSWSNALQPYTQYTLELYGKSQWPYVSGARYVGVPVKMAHIYRWHFQIHIYEWKLLNFNISLKFDPKGLIENDSLLVRVIVLALDRRQALMWTHDVQVPRRYLVSLGHNASRDLPLLS